MASSTSAGTTSTSPVTAGTPSTPSPILGLPNELLDVIVDHIDDQRGWATSHTMACLALASRRFLPFVRARLLQAIVIRSSERIEAVIGWLEAMTYERNMVRQLRVTAVNLTVGTHNDLVSQQRFAHLLTLVPNLRRLEISNWSSGQVQAKLRRAFGSLASLEELSFHAKLAVRNRALACAALLGALPTRTLRLLQLDLSYFGIRGETVIAPPPAVSTRSLRCLDRGGVFPMDISGQGAFTAFAAHLVVLEVPGQLVTAALLNALAPNLKAMTMDDDLADALMDLELQNLEMVSFGSSMTGHPRLGHHWSITTSIATLPILRHVKTFVWTSATHEPDVLRTLLTGHQKLERAIVGVRKPLSALEKARIADSIAKRLAEAMGLPAPAPEAEPAGPASTEDPEVDPMEDLRTAIAPAKLIEAPFLRSPDLLTLLDSGELVTRPDRTYY